jgi:predicted esterase YcpF (UPF0227 family)
MSPILYLHGFNSSPSSHKAQQLIRLMAQLGLSDWLRVPELHSHPRQAAAQIEQAILELGRPLLVGSSLGGYYATHFAERHDLRAVLINPAVLPHRRFDGYLGPQQNLYSGEVWQLTTDHVDALAALEVPPPRAGERIQVWLQTADETLDYRDAETFYRDCVLHIEPGGNHSYAGFAQRLPEVLTLAGLPQRLWRDFDFSTLN